MFQKQHVTFTIYFSKMGILATFWVRAGNPECLMWEDGMMHVEMMGGGFTVRFPTLLFLSIH